MEMDSAFQFLVQYGDNPLSIRIWRYLLINADGRREFGNSVEVTTHHFHVSVCGGLD